MSTCKAFGGHKHQACCGTPALCLENAFQLHAQSPAISSGKDSSWLTLSRTDKHYLSCLCCEIPTSPLWGMHIFKIWLGQLSRIHSAMIISVIFLRHTVLRGKGPVVCLNAAQCKAAQCSLLPAPDPPQSLRREKKAHVRGMFMLMLFKWATNK